MPSGRKGALVIREKKEDLYGTLGKGVGGGLKESWKRNGFRGEVGKIRVILGTGREGLRRNSHGLL